MPTGRLARPFVYPILDADALGQRPAADALRAVAAGGARLVQLRAKTLGDAALLRLAREVVAAATESGLAVIVNDRPDVARIAGAAGVHVGQEDLPPAACRAVLGPSAIVGLSTHDPEQFAAGAREPVDYLAVGPVYPTRTKANPDPVVGLELLQAVRPRWTGTLVAIGGITEENAAAAIEAGADGVAVVSAVFARDDVAEAVRRLRRAIGG